MGSEWYRQRLVAKQQGDARLWRRHLGYLDECLSREGAHAPGFRAELCRRRDFVAAELNRVGSPAYLDEQVGTSRPRPLSPGGVLRRS